MGDINMSERRKHVEIYDNDKEYSAVKKMEVKGTDYVVTTVTGNIFVVSRLKGLNSYAVLAQDGSTMLGVATLFQELIDLITSLDKAINIIRR
jgi:hypothetical protein